jgi:hypothetical protein
MLRNVGVRREKFSDFLQLHVCNNLDNLKTGREISKIYLKIVWPNMVTICAFEFTVGKCNLDEISKLVSGNYAQIMFKLVVYRRPSLLGH